MAGLIAFMGYDGSLFLMGWTGGYVLLAMLLAPYLRKFGKFTVPEFIGDRFYSQTARIVAVICLIVASVTYVIGQMKGIGVAFSRFLEVEFSTGLFIGMAVVFLYAVLGGMKGITYTQIAQYCVLDPGLHHPGNLHFDPSDRDRAAADRPVQRHVESGQPLLTTLNQTIQDLGFGKYTEGSRSTLDITLYTLSLMIGTAGLPHVIIRFFTVPKVRDARASVGWALVFIAHPLHDCARSRRDGAVEHRQHHPDRAGRRAGKQPGIRRCARVGSTNWEKTGLLKFEDKNGDGRIQYYNDKNPAFAAKAAAWGWKGNEMVKVDRDIMVLANPEIAGLPNWVIALVAAGGLAAALSTAAGLLLAISSAISHDLLKGVFRPNISERDELRAARIAMGGTILVAGYLGLHPPGFAAQVVALAFGLAASSIFPALMMGIFNKRMNNAGAVWGMLSGLGITLLYIFWFKGWLFIPGTNMAPNTPDHWFLGISPEAFGAVGAGVNFLVAWLVSRVTAAVPGRNRAHGRGHPRAAGGQGATAAE